MKNVIAGWWIDVQENYLARQKSTHRYGRLRASWVPPAMPVLRHCLVSQTYIPIRFQSFCRQYDLASVQASPLTLQYFCAHESQPVSCKTIKAYLAAIRHYYIVLDLLDTTANNLLHLVCRGIWHLQGDNQHIRLPTNINLLHTIKKPASTHLYRSWAANVVGGIHHCILWLSKGRWTHKPPVEWNLLLTRPHFNRPTAILLEGVAKSRSLKLRPAHVPTTLRNVTADSLIMWSPLTTYSSLDDSTACQDLVTNTLRDLLITAGPDYSLRFP